MMKLFTQIALEIILTTLPVILIAAGIVLNSGIFVIAAIASFPVVFIAAPIMDNL